MTEEELVPGLKLTIRQATNTISAITHEVPVEIVWVEGGHVHYRAAGGEVRQTPIERLLDMINNPPRARN